MKNVVLTSKLLQEYINDPNETYLASFNIGLPPVPLRLEPTFKGFLAWLDKRQVSRKRKQPTKGVKQ
jgi:hypothetical protein